MTRTIFESYAKECKGSGNFLPVILIVTLIIIVGVYTLSDGKMIALGPSPLLIWIIYSATKNKQEDIKIFVNQDKTDFEFGYKDKNNIMKGPYPIQEYTYWCFEKSSTARGWKYDLYFQINSVSRENNAPVTIYFKEEIVSKNPPEGWTRTPQEIKDGVGVYLVPGLTKLAAMIDAVPAPETQIA